MFAPSDPEVRDREVLEAIYELAITYRLSSLGVEEDMHETDADDGKAPEITKKLKAKLESSASKPAVLPTTDIPVPPGQPVH